MTLNVVPVTEWTDLPRFAVQPNIATVLVSDSIQIEDAANEILHDFFGYSSPSQLYLVALAIKSEQRAAVGAIRWLIRVASSGGSTRQNWAPMAAGAIGRLFWRVEPSRNATQNQPLDGPNGSCGKQANTE
ncbi:hypothetical protein R3P38DRAFT_3240721 [Favolaschia claudopus]|uniref:Uncharacterized protein n=1 Tax=Favolaschia claudopus TaxID=2862362 RepID=A0AAV9Z690_9AGAR